MGGPHGGGYVQRVIVDQALYRYGVRDPARRSSAWLRPARYVEATESVEFDELHALMDRVVEDYSPVADGVGGDLDENENQVFGTGRVRRRGFPQSPGGCRIV